MTIWTIPDSGSASDNGTALLAKINDAALASGDTIRLSASSFDYLIGSISLQSGKALTIDCLTAGTPTGDPLGDGAAWGPSAHYAANIAGYIGFNASLELKNVGHHLPAGDWPDKATHQTWLEFFTTKYGAEPPALLYGNDRSSPASLILNGVEFWMGYGGTGAAIGVNGVDPATGLAYDEYKTPTTWWNVPGSGGRTTDVDPGSGQPSQTGYGNWTGLNFDAIGFMPSTTSGFFKSIECQGPVWAHDVGQGFIAAYNGDGSGPGFLFNHPSGLLIERSYSDFIQIAVDSPSTSGPPAFKRAFFIERDALGSGFDDTQDHVDFGQHFSNHNTLTFTGGSGYTDGVHTDALITGGGVTAKVAITVAGGVVTALDPRDSLGNCTLGPVPIGATMTPLNSGQIGAGTGFVVTKGAPLDGFEYEINNGLLYQSPGCRDQPQGPAFWQGGGDHLKAQGFNYRAPKFRNLLAVGTSRLIAVTPAEDLYMRNVVGINPATWAPVIHPNSANIDVTDRGGNYWNSQNRFLRKGVIYEGDVTDPDNDPTIWKSVDAFNTPAQAGAFAAPATLPAQATPQDPANASQVYAHLKTQGAFAAAGPQYTTLRALLTDNTGFAGEYPHLSFVDVTGQEISTGSNYTVSAFSYIHGGNVGDTIPLTIPAGLQVQIYDTDKTTVLTAWSTTLTTATVGKYMQVRALPALTYSTPNTYNIVLNSVTFPWTVTTRSNLSFPRVTKPNTNIVRRTSAGAFAAAGSKQGMAFFEVMIASGQTLDINANLFLQGGSGRNFSMGVGSNGTTWSANLSFSDSSSSGVATASFSGLSCDTWYRIWLMVDSSLATKELAVLSQAQNLTDNSIVTPTLSYTKDALIAWNFSHSANVVQFMPDIAGGFGLMALVAGECFTTFPNFTPEFVGYEGQGLSTTGRQIEVFLPGETTPSNRGITTIAGGGVWGVDTGSLTASGSGSWAPALQLVATVQTAGPFISGQPLDILVQAIGRPQPLNLTGASDNTGSFTAATKAMAEGSNGVTFTYTPSVAGTHNISFTNNATPTYGNPAGIALSVEGVTVFSGARMRMRGR